MSFQRELLFNVFDEVKPLLTAHHAECASAHKLNPRWEQYAEHERLGGLVIFTIRTPELAGYGAYFVGPHLQYADLMVAQNSVLYIKPEHRDKAVAFIRFAEIELQKQGVKKIVYFSTLARDIRKLLNRLGYADEEVMCGKNF